jgi:cell division protein FtsI (penicillin-binding protein 3)
VKREKIPAKRIRILTAVLGIWALAIGARLTLLQVVQSNTYIQKAADQQQDVVQVTPRRGDILDRENNVLATSVEADSVFARPIEMKNPAAVAKRLALLTGIPLNEMLRKLNPDRRWVWIARKISPKQRRAIEKARLPGVYFQTEYRRFYPNRHMAAHLLGYVNVDERGQGGLELKYDREVRGEPGSALWYVDAHGTVYQRETQVLQTGATLITTIDKNFQYIVEKELEAAQDKTNAAGIWIVVMDPNTGAILANANSPSFNPNSYRDFPESTWSVNPTVSLFYEPGSTFKPVTIAAALEEGLTTPDEQIFCENGVIVLGKRSIRDHDPYGWLSVREIMQNSSNVGTIKLGLRVGEERLKSYIDKYGFGQKTQVDLPAEVAGTVHDLSNWTKTSIASISMGHEVTVTPLQTAVMVSTIANGGIRYKPYVVQKIDDPRAGVTEIKPSGTRVMAQTTAGQLRVMLEDVVTDGTAKTSQLEGYRAAGKTGTAEKVDNVNGGYFRSKYVSSFAGFVPVSDPKLTIVVVIDEPKGQHYGGMVAAPVFKRIAEQLLRKMSVLPDVPDYAPRYTGPSERTKEKLNLPSATKKPDVKAFDASIKSAQSGQGGVGFQGGIIVPDFTGQSLRQAMDETGKLGFGQKFEGSGRVVWQDPLPGTAARPGTVVRFKLSLD